MTSNANESLGYLRRNLKAKHPQLRERAYKAFVRPQLEYLLQSVSLIPRIIYI